MRVRIGDREGDFRVEQEDAVTSVSTGRQLRRFETEVSFTVPRDDDVIAFLSDDDARLIAVLDDEEFPCSSKVLSSSYREGDDRRWYRIELQEVEPLDLRELVVAGHQMQPLKYEEETRHDVLTCHVRARLSKATLSKFWALRGSGGGAQYFDVVRHGITDEPRRMRFGRVLWKAVEDDTVEASFVLVDKAYDDDPGSRLRIHGPNEGAVQEGVATLRIIVDRLLDALAAQSVMTADQIEQIRSVSEDAACERELEFYEVRDLDKWE